VFAVLALLSVSAYAEGMEQSMEVDAEGNPLRKPIIMHHGSSPDHIAAIGKIGKILSREPLSANLKKTNEDDDSVTHSINPVKVDVNPSDIKKHIAKENMMHRNAALARLRSKLAKKLAKKSGGKAKVAALKKAGLRITKTGKIVRKKSIFDDDDEKVALEKEIRLLEKLIAQGKKIWSALPEKEARLAALRKKIAEMAAGKAKDAAKKKLKALLALLDKVNDKIEALNNKLKQLLKRKAAIEKQIAKYRAIIAGGNKAKKPKPAAKGKKGAAKKKKAKGKATAKGSGKKKAVKKATKKAAKKAPAKKVILKKAVKKAVKKAAPKPKPAPAKKAAKKAAPKKAPAKPAPKAAAKPKAAPKAAAKKGAKPAKKGAKKKKDAKKKAKLVKKF